jgi:hypothetical protein
MTEFDPLQPLATDSFMEVKIGRPSRGPRQLEPITDG